MINFKNKKIAVIGGGIGGESKFRIHFVCTGNIFRSRLAEAYLKSKVPNILVSSSGTKASLQNKGSIAWHTQRILYRRNLIPYMKNMWNNTTKENLKKADLVIFFGQENYDLCKKIFNFNSDYLIWDIPDFEDKQLNGKPTDISEEIKYLKMSEDSYNQLKEKIAGLIRERNLA